MEIEAAARRINRAAEAAAGAMMIMPVLMAAKYHHYRSVLDAAIVEHNADRCEIVVGTRVDGPVLVPFDRRALAVAGVKGHVSHRSPKG